MEIKDIKFLLSGGLNNNNVDLSVGGQPSRHEIGTNLNNLFSDITREQYFSGYTDYRCFYIFNSNSDDKLKNVSLFARKELGGSKIQIGLSLTNEVQGLMVRGKPHGGHFQLTYIIKHGTNESSHKTREINWVPDAAIMSQRIAAILNSLDQLKGVEVVGTEESDGFDFLVTFAGNSGSRSQELLFVSNELGVDVIITRVVQGGPINLIAPDAGIANNDPSGVEFFDSTVNNRIRIGTLFPLDYMPVWIKREITPSDKIVHPDKFEFKIVGKAGAAGLWARRQRLDSTNQVF